MSANTWVLLWKLSGKARAGVFGGVLLRVLQSLFLGVSFGAAISVTLRLLRNEPFDGRFLLEVTLLCGMSLLCQLIAGYLAARLSWLASYEAVGQMRLALLGHLRKVPVASLGKTQRGDLAALLTTDLQAVETFLSDGLPRVGQALGLPLIVLVAVGMNNLVVALAMAASIVAALPVAAWSGRRIGKLGDKRQAAQAMASSRMIDTVSGMPALRVLSTRQAILRYFDGAVQDFRRISITMVHRIVVPSIATSAVLLLGIPLVMMVVGEHVLSSGELGLAAVVLVLVLNIYQPLLGVVGTAESWRLCEASLRRVARVLDLPQQQEATGDEQPTDASVEFEAVSFDYPDGTVALREVSLRVPEGSMLAIVGPSGAGKTTLLDLIARLNDPTAGAIRIGSADLRRMPSEKLFDLISVVFQEVKLFPGTVTDNIALGRPGATVEEVVVAAKAANAHEFITALPDGYDTVLGEDGAGLSGGQRQRLSIARALLKDSPIVLLDEATAAVDPGSELAINQGISRLLTGRTVIVVAHQLQTIAAADQILVLKDGRVAQTGTHDELIAEKGLYAELWRELTRADRWVLGEGRGR